MSICIAPILLRSYGRRSGNRRWCGWQQRHWLVGPQAEANIDEHHDQCYEGGLRICVELNTVASPNPKKERSQ